MAALTKAPRGEVDWHNMALVTHNHPNPNPARGGGGRELCALLTIVGTFVVASATNTAYPFHFVLKC